MVQSGDRLGFPDETGKGASIIGLIGWQHLQGNLPLQLEMLAQIDRSHTARANSVEDYILANEEFGPPTAHQMVGLKCGQEAVADEKAAAVQHSLPPGGTESSARAPIPTGPPDRIPAHILAEDVPVPISPQVLEPSDAWLVSNGATLVAVYAGAAAEDRSNGRFVIVRQNLAAGIQTEDVVDVPGAGTLALVDAPRGEGVETSAQHAQLGFQGSNGKAGVLDLATDHTITD